MIYNSVSEAIGKTPLIRAKRIENELSLKAALLLKPEGFNPTGSAKDRAALYMINETEKSGALKSGGTIIEPTSGNTGIALAAIGAARGYEVIIVMPSNMSKERIRLISAYGAKVILTDASLGMAGAIEKANALKAEIDGSIIAGQFGNPQNPRSHYETTGPEIWEDTDGTVDVFVCGVGTGGTLSGTGKFLKEKNPDIKIVAVEPADSPLLSKGTAGAHEIQGIGANFIPATLDTSVYDDIITVSTDEAFSCSRLLAEKEGLLCGISSGASLFAAVTLAKRQENKGKNIVCLLTDTGERYLSTALFGE